MISLKEQLAKTQYSQNISTISSAQAQGIIQRSFLWMGIITFIVFAVGYYIVSLIKTGSISPEQYIITFWVSTLGGLGIILIISLLWEKFSYTILATLGVLFAILEGVGIAGILSFYNTTSIINAFAGAGILFLLMALYGYFTKTDLTKLGTIFLVGLISIIILSIINIFLIKSSTFDLILSILGLIIFLGLTAWNLQTLKLAAQTGNKKLEIVFGISLYLDFINIFLTLLKIFGSNNK